MSNDPPASNRPKTAIAPLIFVRRGREAVDFYKAAFGAQELFRIENDGAVVATLSVNGAEFWVADESPADGNFSPETLAGGTVRMILTVADPDAAFARAIAAGTKKFGRWPTNTAGTSDESSTRSDIIGKSAGRSPNTPRTPPSFSISRPLPRLPRFSPNACPTAERRQLEQLRPPRDIKNKTPNAVAFPALRPS